MRIITGKLKGRKIPVPETGDLRPTADRTKEGIFNVISARRFFEGLNVLDLFAGSGNLGFEAISRGADSVLFVDRNPEHLKQIDRLAAKFDVRKHTASRPAAVEEYLSHSAEEYDLIFSDPPYDYPYLEEMLNDLLQKGWLASDGWLILEHDRRYDFQDHKHCFYTKAYGRTMVSMFSKQPVDSE